MEIAILDSGVNPWHSHVQSIKGGLGFQSAKGGNVTITPDFCDRLGHGTAIAGIIRRGAPEADLFAFKIFHDALSCSTDVLMEAILWAIKAKIKLIHLSLGTLQSQYQSDLEALADQAYAENIIMVAAARSDADDIFPAKLKTVLGVYWHKDCPEGKIVHSDKSAVEFGTYGRPLQLPGQPREMNFSGNSFAAAHVSAMAAQILTDSPQAGPEEVRERLVQLFGTQVLN